MPPCAPPAAPAGEDTGVIKRKPGGSFTVDKTFDQVSADYDALIVPGGTVGADKLRGDAGAVRLIRGFFGLASQPGLSATARGRWSRRTWSAADQGLVTSRGPHDLPAFCAKIVEEFAEGKHTAQARSA